MQAYYSWLESEGQPVGAARRLLEYRDVDSCPEEFLSHFQAKYLYGVPFTVVVNKRLLLKHILEVYRSKGSIRGFRLLFRLIYDEDLDVYLPGTDLLRPSDSIWVEPSYIEVTLPADPTAADDASELQLRGYVGQTIVGASSGVKATVEDVVSRVLSGRVVTSIYLSSISPPGGQFRIGERVGPTSVLSSDLIFEAPIVTGSADTLNIQYSTANFEIGDVVRVAHRDPATGTVAATGDGALFRVSRKAQAHGAVNFSIQSGGWGYALNAASYVIRNVNDHTGYGASVKVGTLRSARYLSVCNDLWVDHQTAWNGATLGFTGNSSGNASSTWSTLLSHSNALFGSIASLTGVQAGREYYLAPRVVIRDLAWSGNLAGSIAYSSTSNTITGTSTKFQSVLYPGCFVRLQANSANAATIEELEVLSVASNTSAVLYNRPSLNSTASSTVKAGLVVIQSNYGSESYYTKMANGSMAGANELVVGSVNQANAQTWTATELRPMSSGIGYIDGELVTAYKYGVLSDPIIVDPGIGYANGDSIAFVIDDPFVVAARGAVTTDSSGRIATTVLSFEGSGYNQEPVVVVVSNTGSGADLRAQVVPLDDNSTILGTIAKKGVGISTGSWANTDSFLNANKYIQDSYYYQDFSYELQAAQPLTVYKDIIYDTFHVAGTALFGKFKSSEVGVTPALSARLDVAIGSGTTSWISDAVMQEDGSHFLRLEDDVSIILQEE